MAFRKSRSRKGPRRVQCYHCRHRFEVGPNAESTNCPQCSQRVIVGDVIVSAILPVKLVQTCGRVVIKPKGRVNADLIEAHEGVEVNGGVTANVLSGGAVIIGPKARWKGDCRAPSVEIKPGARIEGGCFIIPDETLGLHDMAAEAAELAAAAEAKRVADEQAEIAAKAAAKEAAAQAKAARMRAARKPAKTKPVASAATATTAPPAKPKVAKSTTRKTTKTAKSTTAKKTTKKAAARKSTTKKTTTKKAATKAAKKKATRKPGTSTRTPKPE